MDRSELGAGRTLQQLGIHKSALYKWYKAYLNKGTEGLQPERKTRRQWNSIPEVQKQLVVEIALDHPQLSPRELAVKLTDEQGIFISQVQCVPYSEGQGFDYYAGSYSAFCF